LNSISTLTSCLSKRQTPVYKRHADPLTRWQKSVNLPSRFEPYRLHILRMHNRLFNFVNCMLLLLLLLLLVLSTTDGIILRSKEARILRNKLSALLAEKWEREVGETLLQSLRICQSSYEHRHRQSHPYVSVGLVVATIPTSNKMSNRLPQCWEGSRRRRPRPLPADISVPINDTLSTQTSSKI
jgi:hypothetical protein